MKLIESPYVQILCGLDSARKNAMLLLAMMVLRRKGPLNHGPTHQYIAPNIDVERMKDLDYDDVLLDRYEPINVLHAIRDRLLDSPWEPPTSASAPNWNVKLENKSPLMNGLATHVHESEPIAKHCYFFLVNFHQFAWHCTVVYHGHMYQPGHDMFPCALHSIHSITFLA